MSTRLDIQTRLNMDFQNNSYYKTIDYNDSIQDGLDEIVAFTGSVYATATLPFTNGTTYYDMLTLLPNYIGVIAIYNAVINRFLDPTSITKLDQDRIDWECCAGTPYFFVPVSHRYIAIYKKPITNNYGNMYVYYRASAPTLTDSTLLPVPDDHIIVLENYCKCDLLEQNQEFTKAGEKFQDYMEQLNDLHLYLRQMRNPDRMRSLR